VGGGGKKSQEEVERITVKLPCVDKEVGDQASTVTVEGLISFLNISMEEAKLKNRLKDLQIESTKIVPVSQKKKSK